MSGSPIIGLPSSNPPPLSAWPMNEGAGLTLHDVSGNGNTATISGAGAVTWQTNAGLPGTTPLWTGTGYATSVSTTLTNFDGTKPFSIGFWEADTTVGAFIGSFNVAVGLTGWEINQNTSSALEFAIVSNYNAPTNRLDVTAPLNANSGLHSVLVTYDGSRSPTGIKIYIDGVSVAVTTLSNTLSASAANNLPITFGARQNGSSFHVSGPMAFVEIWPYVVSATTAAANYAKGPGIY